MGFNYREGGSWKQPTLKRREGDQWVTIGGGGGGGGDVPSLGGERWYTDGPPTRDGAEILYPDDGHSSLQAAAEALNSGDTLTITQNVDGERLKFHDASDVSNLSYLADHITIQGDGSNPYIRSPENTNDRYTVGTSHDDIGGGTRDTYFYHELDSIQSGASIDKGDTQIPVNDAQQFVDAGVSEGDTVWVWEDLYPKNAKRSRRFEHCIVESIDTSTDVINIRDPVWFPYPNTTTNEVGYRDWLIEDIVIRDLEIHNWETLSANTWPFFPMLLRYLWVENVAIRYASNKGNIVRMEGCHKSSWHNIEVTDNSHYGLQPGSGTTDVYVNGIEGRRINRYVYRAGPPTRGDRHPAPAGGLVENISGHDLSSDQFVFNNHNGGFWQTANGLTADGCAIGRFRSQGIEMHNVFEDGPVDDRPSIVYAQRPTDCVLNGEGTSPNITNKGNTNHNIFSFNLNYDSRSGDMGENITIKNFDIDAYGGNDATDIGGFHDGTEIRGDLVFDHVTYDGEYLTRSDIESWDGYSSSDINNLVVKP